MTNIAQTLQQILGVAEDMFILRFDVESRRSYDFGGVVGDTLSWYLCEAVRYNRSEAEERLAHLQSASPFAYSEGVIEPDPGEVYDE